MAPLLVDTVAVPAVDTAAEADLTLVERMLAAVPVLGIAALEGQLDIVAVPLE